MSKLRTKSGIFKALLLPLICAPLFIAFYALLWAGWYRLPTSQPVSMDLRKSPTETPYYIAFCAALAANPHGFPGHSYITFGKEDPAALVYPSVANHICFPRESAIEEWESVGFVPLNAQDQVPSLFRPVRGLMVDHAARKNTRGLAMFVAVVNQATYEKARKNEQIFRRKYFSGWGQRLRYLYG
jgi:hypothetical protein